jgi:hypothetical protein
LLRLGLALSIPSSEEDIMRRVRIEQKVRRLRDHRDPALPMDPRDPEILRAKRADRAAFKDRERL